jgi:hypothetical protein
MRADERYPRQYQIRCQEDILKAVLDQVRSQLFDTLYASMECSVSEPHT